MASASCFGAGATMSWAGAGGASATAVAAAGASATGGAGVWHDISASDTAPVIKARERVIISVPAGEQPHWLSLPDCAPVARDCLVTVWIGRAVLQSVASAPQKDGRHAKTGAEAPVSTSPPNRRQWTILAAAFSTAFAPRSAKSAPVRMALSATPCSLSRSSELSGASVPTSAPMAMPMAPAASGFWS